MSPRRKAPEIVSNPSQRSSLPPLLKRWQYRGTVLFPAFVALKPILGSLVHPGIPSRVVSKCVQPSLSLGEAECLPVEPRNEAKPEEFTFARVPAAVCFGVVQKSWTAVVQKPFHVRRYHTFGLYDQAHPERERAPLDIVIDGGTKAFGTRKAQLGLSQLFGFAGQGRLGLAVESLLHADNDTRGGSCPRLHGLPLQPLLSIPLYHIAVLVRKTCMISLSWTNGFGAAPNGL